MKEEVKLADFDGVNHEMGSEELALVASLKQTTRVKPPIIIA